MPGPAWWSQVAPALDRRKKKEERDAEPAPGLVWRR
jgi:hypothetical protein